MVHVKWSPAVLVDNMACCKSLGIGTGCAKCGEHTHFTVDWLIPSKEGDSRPACSARCAARIREGR